MKKRMILKRVVARNAKHKRLFYNVPTRERLHRWYYLKNIPIRTVILNGKTNLYEVI